MNNCQGFTRFTKRDFFRLFWPAWEKAVLKENVQSGWKRTGLEPFNPKAVLSRYRTDQPPKPVEFYKRPSLSELTGSALILAD